MLVYRFISCYSLKKYKRLVFLSFLLQSIKQRFEQTLYMIYCSIQNVLVIGIGI